MGFLQPLRIPPPPGLAGMLLLVPKGSQTTSNMPKWLLQPNCFPSLSSTSVLGGSEGEVCPSFSQPRRHTSPGTQRHLSSSWHPNVPRAPTAPPSPAAPLSLILWPGPFLTPHFLVPDPLWALPGRLSARDPSLVPDKSFPMLSRPAAVYSRQKSSRLHEIHT